MPSDRDVEWISFPADLYFDKSISFQEKAFLMEIRSLARRDPDRGCWALNRHFAEQFDLSISRVSEVISKMESRGLIRVEMSRIGRQVIERNIFLTDDAIAYWAGPKPSEKAKTPFGKGEDPPSEKAKENSTRVNRSIEENKRRESDARESDLFGEEDSQPESRILLTEKKKESARDDEFEAFWAQFGRKTSRGAAIRAYRTARKKASADEILAGVMRAKQNDHRFQGDPQFQPHAATWLNAEGWTDVHAPRQLHEERSRYQTPGERNHESTINAFRRVFAAPGAGD